MFLSRPAFSSPRLADAGNRRAGPDAAAGGTGAPVAIRKKSARQARGVEYRLVLIVRLFVGVDGMMYIHKIEPGGLVVVV